MQYEYRDTFYYNGKRYDVKAHTKRELNRKMEERKAKAKNEAPPSGSISVREWADRAIETYKTNQKDITRKKFKRRVDHCILEHIGGMRLVDVRPIDCQDVLNRQAGNSATQINEIYNALRLVFRTAVENGLLAKSPAEHLTKPAGARTHRRALTDEERQLVRRVAQKKSKYTMYLLMLECGLRPSEAAECKGGDIIVQNSTPCMHVRGTKTASADRIVPIPSKLFTMIQNTPKSAYIASYEGGGKITETNRNRVWQSFRRDMNIELGARMYRNELLEDLVAPDLVPYCLRHDYCTRLANAGVDIRTAQRLMGHSTIELTANIYTHVGTDALIDAVKCLESVENAVETIPQIIEI